MGRIYFFNPPGLAFGKNLPESESIPEEKTFPKSSILLVERRNRILYRSLLDHAQCSCFRSRSMVWGCLSNVYRLRTRSRTAALDCVGWSIGDPPSRTSMGITFKDFMVRRRGLQRSSFDRLEFWRTDIEWFPLGGTGSRSCRFLRVKSFHDQHQPSHSCMVCPGTQQTQHPDAEKLEHLYRNALPGSSRIRNDQTRLPQGDFQYPKVLSKNLDRFGPAEFFPSGSCLQS